MPDFVNRERELELACGQSAPPLLTFYGEADIGKTSLLNAAKDRIMAQSPPRVVAYVDFEELPLGPAGEPLQWVLRSLAAVICISSRLQQTDEAWTADLLVRCIGACDPPPVLMFDATEKLQTDTHFWERLEAGLVRPLLMGGRVRMIFAGRVPPPWRDYDVRRLNQTHRLAPLSTQDDLARQGAARDLIRNVLRQGGPNVTEADVGRLTELILEFSHGHPGLSKELASWVVEPGADRWPTANFDRLRKSMAEDKIKNYIDAVLFKDIDADWRRVLRWASILNWFDTAVLQQYLEALVAADVIPRGAYLNNWDGFFVEGIDRLRLQDAAVVWDRDGYRLYGVTREIVRQCLKVTDPAGSRRASQCAGEVIQAVANEFAPDEEGFARYTGEAKAFFQQAQEEVV